MHKTFGSCVKSGATGLFFAGLISLSSLQASAGEALTKPISQWYEALETNDSELVSIIVMDTAKIELRDLGIVQTARSSSIRWISGRN